jgi:hypothetical protein
MGMSADKPMKDGTASRVLGLLWGRKANRDDGKANDRSAFFFDYNRRM